MIITGFERYVPQGWMDEIFDVHLKATSQAREKQRTAPARRVGRWTTIAVSTALSCAAFAGPVDVRHGSFATLEPVLRTRALVDERVAPDGYFSALEATIAMVPRLPAPSRAMDPVFRF